MTSTATLDGNMRMMEKKAMIGHKVRRFRLDHGLNQTEMAAQLSISPSYLNLIEHNQRPVTVPLLFRLSQAFEVDLREFAEDDDARLASDLTEVFADALFQDQPVSQRDLRDLIDASPTAAKGILNLYKAYSSLREDAETLNHQFTERGKGIPTHSAAAAIEEVREYQEAQSNHFTALESAAELLRGDFDADPDTLRVQLTAHLRQHHS
ncbi:MAG TPA: XRE family transcriptional regulator, partial [Alphaproteobacteria bacterium]|nr:XRE family transcriptional regulator [Alphaproteobacteria bacterium]